MFDPSWLWAVFTIVAAAAQTVRNAAQRELTTRLGTVGATHVRFLFGFPFALMFLAGVMIALGQGLPRPPPAFWPWVVLGALTQVAATALMLAAMNDRSFVVTIAYIKTEAIQGALFGLIFLGDPLTIGMVAAILVATAGVVAAGFAPAAGLATATKSGNHTVTSVELVVFEQPTKMYAGVLVKGQRFKVTKLSKSGKYAYGMAYGQVNKKGWVDAKALVRK